MHTKQIELYRKLGYKESFSVSARGATKDRFNVAELPPLGPDELEKLKERLNADPEAVLARARRVWDSELTEDQLRTAIEEAQTALKSPDTFIRMLEAQEAHETAVAFAVGAQRRGNHLLPPEFSFPGMTDDIPIDPTLRKFETQGDLAGWVLLAGPLWIYELSGFSEKAPFRWHNHPHYQPRKFVYDLQEPTEESPLEIALFSDFGTGLYHALYIARQFEQRKFPYAIHLGDVYYAGRQSEFRDHFESPLNPILRDTRLFMLNANHEMLSGGIPYFDYIDTKKQSHPDIQEQEGSYFCLRSSRFQLVGIDTDYHEEGRFMEPGLADWLENVLREGRREKRVNILLSANEPYEYGKLGRTPLLTRDLSRFMADRLIDLWFWGNTHYCALFDRTYRTPFIGSCIGHAGYPYTRRNYNQSSPAPVRFLEARARFPEWTELRQDRGNNGYCVLRLKADGTMELNYIDWMSNLRCEATLSKTSHSGRLNISHIQIYDQ